MTLAQRADAHAARPKVVVLDRDGVINEDRDDYIKTPDEWRAIPGSLDAIARLNRAGYRVAVATNQSAVGRGIVPVATLDAIHAKMTAALAVGAGRIDALLYCPHVPESACRCRKPEPGMLREIARRLAFDLHGVAVIGDSLADVRAAIAVGARPMLVMTGKGRRTAADAALPPDVEMFADLSAAVDALLSDEHRRRD